MNTIDKDPAMQWKWHEAHRDLGKNMYRTSYTDMTHFREVHVRSDFPAGYGGHIPSMRHDVLFRNTEIDRKMSLMRHDPNRDALPSFNDQLAGIPTSTKFPCGAKKNPTHKVCLHDGTTKPLAPWGITVNTKRDPLTMRHTPPTMRKTSSMPGFQNRSHDAARVIGSKMAGSGGMGDMGRASTGQLGQGMSGYREGGDYDPRGGDGSYLSPGGDGLRRKVDLANEDAQWARMPTEADILRDQQGAY
jgi:hypothetical protein